MAVLPYWSLAVTVIDVLPPAVTVAGDAVTVKVLAAAGLTVTDVLPVIELVTVSVAVTDWLPAVFSVAPPEKVCAPASVEVKV